MKPLRHVVILTAGLTALGCQVSKQDAELLERDLRVQEDEIYALRDCVDTYQQKLAACRSENRALRKELAARGGLNDDFVLPGGSSIEPAPSRQLPGAESAPAAESEPGQLPEAPPFQPPVVSPPAAPEPEGMRLEQPPLQENPPTEFEPAGPQPLQSSSAAAGAGAALAQYAAPRSNNLLQRIARPTAEQPIVDPVHDLEVTEITLNNMLTGGLNQDKAHGDEGILVVVEPRNSKNQIVAAFGDISIVVLDPALEGEAARVARWDVTSQELEDRFRNRQFGRGFQLQLPWPGDPPQHSTLHLFVRFVAADGRKLIADRPLEIDPPGGATAGGWVPAARSNAAVDELGPELTPVPSSNLDESRSVRQAVESGPASLRPRDVPGRRGEPSPAGEAAAERPVERTAGNPPQEPTATGKKQRPRWTPYR